MSQGFPQSVEFNDSYRLQFEKLSARICSKYPYFSGIGFLELKNSGRVFFLPYYQGLNTKSSQKKKIINNDFICGLIEFLSVVPVVCTILIRLKKIKEPSKNAGVKVKIDEVIKDNCSNLKKRTKCVQRCFH